MNLDIGEALSVGLTISVAGIDNGDYESIRESIRESIGIVLRWRERNPEVKNVRAILSGSMCHGWKLNLTISFEVEVL